MVYLLMIYGLYNGNMMKVTIDDHEYIGNILVIQWDVMGFRLWFRSGRWEEGWFTKHGGFL